MTYKGNRFFTIHISDVGQEAHDDRYVRWLERRVEELEEELRNEQISGAQVYDELRRG